MDPRFFNILTSSPLLYMIQVLTNAVPKLIDIGDNRRPVLVFSDGAWEPGASKPDGAGLVLIDPVGGVRAVHQVAIPPKLLEFWMASGKKQVITELELWPVVVGMQNLASFLHRRRVLWFIDNNAVKDMLVKGSTRGSNLFVMITEALHRAVWCYALVFSSSFQTQHCRLSVTRRQCGCSRNHRRCCWEGFAI